MNHKQHLQVLKDERFSSGNYDTSFIENFHFDPALMKRGDYPGSFESNEIENIKEVVNEPTE